MQSALQAKERLHAIGTASKERLHAKTASEKEQPAHPPRGCPVQALGRAQEEHVAGHDGEDGPDQEEAPEQEVEGDDCRHQPQAQQRGLQILCLYLAINFQAREPTEGNRTSLRCKSPITGPDQNAQAQTSS